MMTLTDNEKDILDKALRLYEDASVYFITYDEYMTQLKDIDLLRRYLHLDGDE